MEKGAVGLEMKMNMLDLPHHILSDIMVKLPPSSILACACVCTTFRNIVTDPAFQQLYFSRAPTWCVVLSDHHRLSSIHCSAHSQQRTPSSSCLASFRTSASPSASSLSGIDPISNQNQPLLHHHTTTRFIAFQGRIKLVNSSHGLLCLRSHSHSLYYVCNPLLGEILTLPPPPTAAYEFSAFGFDPLSKHYKLLQTVLKPDKVVAELYQLGDDTWTVIDNASSARPNSSFDPSLNGALHWVTRSTRISELICSFDLHTHEFKLVPPPSHFDAEYVNQIFGISVGALKGRLCLCYVSGGVQFETWLMEEYGVEGSWTKAFAIDIPSYCGLRLHDKHRPIGFSSCGDMWLKPHSDSDPHSQQCLVSYSPQNRVFRQIDVGGIASNNVEATPHVFSFVSLKDIVNIRNTHLRFEIIRPNKHY